MYMAFNILKSNSLFLLAPGILLALGVNTACCFGVGFAIESKLKKARAKMKDHGFIIDENR